MNRLLALLLIAPSCCTESPDVQHDPVLVLHEVIVAEAKARGTEEPRPCVEPHLDGVAFDDTRQRLASLAKEPRWKAQFEAERRNAQSPFFVWRGRASREPAVRTLRSELDAEQVRLLSEAAGRILISSRETRAAPTLEGQALSPPLRLCTKGQKQFPVLYFSAPALAGDLAFVEAGYVCGGLCGNGLLYGLRRTSGGWKVLGVTDTWIS